MSGISRPLQHSVITFVGGSTFKTEVPACVTQGIGYIDYIKSFQQPIFSQAEVDACSSFSKAAMGYHHDVSEAQRRN